MRSLQQSSVTRAQHATSFTATDPGGSVCRQPTPNAGSESGMAGEVPAEGPLSAYQTEFQRQVREPRARLDWLDNLRTCMVCLVVLCHAGGVYESSGTWASFWIVDDPATNDVAGLVFLLADIVMMPTLFFISGFLAPLSLRDRSAWSYVKSKFKRLIIPWALASVTLLPLYKMIFLYSRHLPQQHWTTYFHWSNGVWSQNWLWFLPVLFLFHMLYVVGSRLPVRFPHISLRAALLATFVCGVGYCVAIDEMGLRGWTQSIVIDFQNERLLVYGLAFLVGTLCVWQDVFRSGTKGMWLYAGVQLVAWIPVTFYLVFLLHPWFHPGTYLVSATADTWVLWCSYMLSVYSLVYLAVETCRRYRPRKKSVLHAVNRNALYVYLIHVVVLGVVATWMLSAAIPSLTKYLVVAIVTFVASHILVSFTRRLVHVASRRPATC